MASSDSSPAQVFKHLSTAHTAATPDMFPEVVHGDVSKLSPKVSSWIVNCAKVCQPDKLHICDGSEEENKKLVALLQADGVIKPLPKYENCWLAKTDPADVARVERLTFIATPNRRDTTPTPKEGVKGLLNNWMLPEEMDDALGQRFPGCMKGRTMYVIPFSMGPLGSPLAKTGIQLTDSAYVVCSMRIMTRMGEKTLQALGNDDFVKCLHSVGQPLPTTRPIINSWPCNPEKTIIAHYPERNQIASFGSGYGGNSLLGKKCLALRLGCVLAKKEGWLAEHMLILGITNPQGKKIYVTAAFPSACGKTNLAMLVPSIPGYKVETVGDDIAWLKYDEHGVLRAINPEAGFFGVAPGTSYQSNPNAMESLKKNTIFTNVAETPDGGFWWEGLEKDIPIEGQTLTDWTGKPWTAGCGRPSSHPNSRFCAPAGQCPVIDPLWEDPKGVPISAMIFGGRRPEGVPLVYEARDWEHGVFIGATVRSEATAAAEFTGKVVMHDPFAMRPFLGYNFGDYIKHWLSFQKNPKYHLPKIYHVNWFRRDAAGKFLWPGFGENCRVLDWIVRRVSGENCAVESPIGFVPTPGSIDVSGLTPAPDMDELFRVPKDFWLEEANQIEKYLDEQLTVDYPDEMKHQVAELKKRLQAS